MSFKNSKFDLLGRLATALSLFACYGTIAIIGVLSSLGIVIVLNETLWAGTIIAFAALAIIGFLLGLFHHRKPGPLFVGGTGLVTLSYVMYVQYDRLTELVGFILLCCAAFWDWRLRRRIAKSLTFDKN